MTSSHDAIVVGAGPNGLVAANYLADAGWRVLVLEEQPEPGGAVRSDRELAPDFVHDTFSAFYPLAVASSAMVELRLEEYGLAWAHAPAVLGHVMSDGRWALLHRDRHITASLLDDLAPGDGETWLDLCATWDRVGGPLVDALTSPFPPIGPGARLLRRLPSAGGLDLVRTLLTPVASLARHGFAGEAPGLLLAGNAGHADLPMNASGSGVFGLLMTMLGQTVGFPVPRGGAGQLTAAMVRRLEARGGEVRTGAAVDRVVVDDGRAVAVTTTDEHRYEARCAVIAAVSAPALFQRLLDRDDVPAGVERAMKRFELDPATVKIDWALDGPVPWASTPAYAPGTVHVGDSVPQMMESGAQVASGTIPAKPFLLSGQMTTSDPARSPAGTESFWAYTHVPQPDRTRTDAGPDNLRGRWDHDECARFADRVQGRLEALAPGFGARVRDRRVLGPHELEARDASLVGGALNGGTSQLHQQLFLRPVPAMLGRPATGVRSLFLASSSAHPGGGVHGAAGANAARAALARHPWDAVARRMRSEGR